eukprot:Transcript_17186.p2 GENE.Transcript_17186~~Transcript_17186.p2  ORF type:complete len:271 (-),score=86.84 Transcript_17186:693-1505(-)
MPGQPRRHHHLRLQRVRARGARPHGRADADVRVRGRERGGRGGAGRDDARVLRRARVGASSAPSPRRICTSSAHHLLGISPVPSRHLLGTVSARDAPRARAPHRSGGSFEWATKEEERRRLWQARHGTYYASLALRPGSRGIITDAAVPISQLAAVIEATAADVDASGVVGPIFGHAGDGNFHCILLAHPDDPPEYLERLHAVHHRLLERAIACGGTCTGEHGVGVGKKAYLVRQHGEGAVGAMRAVKRALDPLNILNPDKVVDMAAAPA